MTGKQKEIYKKMAMTVNLLTVKSQVLNYTTEDGSKLPKELISIFQHEENNITGRLRVGKKYLKRVEADLIKSDLKLKRKVYKHREKI